MLALEVAQWLAGLIDEATTKIEHGPGLTIEIEGDSTRWVQVIPVTSAADGLLSGFILNFPYRGNKGNPLETLRLAGLNPPPGTEALLWEDGGFAKIQLQPDVPRVPLALFIGDLLEKVEGAQEGFEITVQVEYGY